MLDPYEILGVTQADNLTDIKKAYRKLAMKHHPDKGGSTTKFQEIKEAYELIKLHHEKITNKATFNSTKREYRFHDANDFSSFFANQRKKPNRFVNVNAHISIQNAVNGGRRSLTIQYHGMTEPAVFEIEVPIGIQDRETIRYPGILGNGTIDLNVTFHIESNNVWALNGIDITKKEQFSFWELITGTTRNIDTISNGKVKVIIPPTTEPGTKLKLKSLGAVSRQDYLHKGDMYVEIIATIPKNIPDNLLQQIKDL